mgnify:CR=1 FL=1
MSGLSTFFILSPVLFSPQKIVACPVLPKNFLAYIDTKFLQKRLFKYSAHKVQLQKKFQF